MIVNFPTDITGISRNKNLRITIIVNTTSRNIERDLDVDRQLFALDCTVVHFVGKYLLKLTDKCVRYTEKLI